jgi:type II secretory pathway component PulC
MRLALLAGMTLSLVAGSANARAVRDAPGAACATQPRLDRAGIADWPRNARLVVRKGEAVGLLFYALSPDVPLARAGLKQGDVLLRIAGVALTSPENALTAYARLRHLPCATMIVEREGSEVELPFRLH